MSTMALSARASDGVLVDLGELTTSSHAGGKARCLGRMLRLGLPVPEGVAIPAAVLTAAIGAPASGDPTAARLVSALAELRASLAPGEPLIVRSSALGEDSVSSSFAGQHDSVRDVTSRDELERATRTVWSSLGSDRAIAYRRARGLSDAASMGIVVQRQVAARFAGVLFTASPAGDPRMLGEMCVGDSEGLVAGRVTPGRFHIDRADFALDIDTWPEGWQREHDDVAMASLRELAEHARTLEREFGAPQDIEWLVDFAGRLWIVQSRPITTAPAQTPVVWSDANINENYPGPVTPCLYAIAAAAYTAYFRGLARAFGLSRRRRAAMEAPLARIVGAHGARLYYNLSSIHAVLRGAPFGEHLVRSFNLFVGADEETADSDRTRPARLTAGFEVARMAATLAVQALRLERRVRRFERRVTDFAARTSGDRLAASDPSALAAEVRAFLEIRLERWTDAALADAAAMLSYGLLERLLREAGDDGAGRASHNDLLKGLETLVSDGPVHDLWALSRAIRRDPDAHRLFRDRDGTAIWAALHAVASFAAIRAGIQTHLDEWGFRCSGELMLTTPTFAEEPAALLEVLRGYVALDGEGPAAALTRQAGARVEATRRVLAAQARRPLHRLVPFVRRSHLLSVVLAATQRAIALRERARMKQALLYTRLRATLLRLGDELTRSRLVSARDDVFFLTPGELIELGEGRALLPHATAGLVALRRAEQARAARMTPPPSFTLPAGAYLARDPTPGRDDRGADPATLTGTGACGGVARGPAAVLASVAEAAKLAPGDVLVAEQTDPGWTPIFFLAGGLVLERGGMLSHGAIVAREFGIPTVVGVRGAASAIRSGQRVEVNGDHGEVRVLA